MKNHSVGHEMGDLGPPAQINDLRHHSLNEILKANMEIMKPTNHHHDPHHYLGFGHHSMAMDCGGLSGSGQLMAGNDNNNNHSGSSRSDSNNNHSHGPANSATSAAAGSAGRAGSGSNSNNDCDDDLSKNQLILIDDERSSIHDDDDVSSNPFACTNPYDFPLIA